MIRIGRIYEKPGKGNGFRILVDRLWPRGVKKSEAKINLWLKDIAPSDSLRKWFSHDPEKWKEFQKRYRAELKGRKELLRQIKRLEKENKNIMLIYSAKDKEHNNAVVLAEILKKP